MGFNYNTRMYLCQLQPQSCAAIAFANLFCENVFPKRKQQNVDKTAVAEAGNVVAGGPEVQKRQKPIQTASRSLKVFSLVVCCSPIWQINVYLTTNLHFKRLFLIE